MAGKKFKFRCDGNRRVGIKEVITRNMTMRGQRISVSVGLDKDFNLSIKHIIKDNILIPVKDTIGFKKGKGGKAIYYPLDEISYIVTIILQYNRNNKIVEKTLTLYEPRFNCSLDEIYCLKITTEISQEEKEMILNNVFGYAVSRV